MNRILNYIARGKGVGAIIILLVCTIFSSVIGISIRNLAHVSVPYVQMIADEVLPLKMENGTITTPKNFKKDFPVFIDDDDVQYSFVIDTTTDSLDVSKLDNGIYITRTQMYAVDNAQGKIESQKLKGTFNLEKKDYTDILKAGIKWIVIITIITAIICFFIMYFILNIFYAFCASIAEKVANTTLTFDTKMRLSAICLSFMLFVSFALGFIGINISWYIFLASVICMQILIVKKLANK